MKMEQGVDSYCNTNKSTLDLRPNIKTIGPKINSEERLSERWLLKSFPSSNFRSRAPGEASKLTALSRGDDAVHDLLGERLDLP